MVEYVQVLKHENAELQGTEDPKLERIKVLKPARVLAGAKEQIC